MEAGGKQLRRAEARQYALNGGKKEYEGGACCADDEPTAEYGLPQACANGSYGKCPPDDSRQILLYIFIASSRLNIAAVRSSKYNRPVGIFHTT